MEKSTHFTLLYLIVVGGYIAFFQIFHPQNHFTMTLPPFYQNVKLGPAPTFYYQILLHFVILLSFCNPLLPPHIKLF